MSSAYFIRIEEAAIKAAIEQSIGSVAACARQPTGAPDKDVCAIDFALFDLRFRVRIGDIEGRKFVSFARSGANYPAAFIPAFLTAAEEAASVLRERKAIAFDRCARNLEALINPAREGVSSRPSKPSSSRTACRHASITRRAALSKAAAGTHSTTTKEQSND